MTTFSKAIKQFIADAGLIGINALANYAEAAPSTIKRWAAEVARPMPNLQKEVIDWVGKYISDGKTKYDGKLHIYGPFIQNDDAYIVGDKVALTKLKGAIDEALMNGESIISASTNDDKEFDAIVICGSMKNNVALPYIDKSAKDRRKEAIPPYKLCGYKKLKNRRLGKEKK